MEPLSNILLIICLCSNIVHCKCIASNSFVKSKKNCKRNEKCKVYLILLSDTGEVKKRHRTYSDSTANCTAETEYLRTARLGGGHKGI